MFISNYMEVVMCIKMCFVDSEESENEIIQQL